MISFYYNFIIWSTYGISTSSYEIELAISAIGAYLYLLTFLRALRPVGHYIVIITRIFA